MAYVDGFVLVVPEDRLEDYRKQARMAGKIWMEYGALHFCECVGDDLEVHGMRSFAQLAKPRPGEVVVFSWIYYKSRAHRDRVTGKVLSDPRLAGMDPKSMPFDVKRMAYGGFKPIVDLKAE